MSELVTLADARPADEDMKQKLYFHHPTCDICLNIEAVSEVTYVGLAILFCKFENSRNTARRFYRKS